MIGGGGGGQKSVPIRWVLYHHRALYLGVQGCCFANGILYLLVRGFRHSSLKFENSIFEGHT